MAKTEKEVEIQSTLGLAEVEDLDHLVLKLLPNLHEFVEVKDTKNGHIVSRIQRIEVYKLAAVMSSVGQIARVMGVDGHTITKHFKKEVGVGHAIAKQKLMIRFYHQAVYGNVPSHLIFALKNWANMSDAGLTEELTETEEGVEFVIRKPVKPVITENKQAEYDNFYDAETGKRTVTEENIDDETA